MNGKFKNKYTTKSARLKNYDYSQNGMYFVTICTKDREEFFGEIKNGKMILSGVGKIANAYWQEISKHFPFVKLDKFVVMPNHFHGIIEICNSNHLPVETPNLGVSTIIATKNWKSGCLGAIINQYKRICTITIKNQNPHIYFRWQSRFYDHIIRDGILLNKIREYIEINPKMWERDRNNLENLYI